MKFSIKDFFSFTEEILNGKFHFLCSDDGVFLQKRLTNNYRYGTLIRTLYYIFRILVPLYH